MSAYLAIKALVEEGVPTKEIARRVGRDVRTVRKWRTRLQAGGGHEPRRKVEAGLLAPFLARLEALVARDLSAVQIYGELGSLEGFTASYVTVRRQVRVLRRTHPEAYCRMRYAAGEEGQVDFGDFGLVTVGDRRMRAWLFVLTLCYSRRAYYEIVLDQTVPSFLGALRRAFEHFGGAPKRLKPDNLKAAVLLDQLGRRYYQEDFFRFCRHHGTVPEAARPGTPTDKGRVERDIRYCKGSFLRGRAVEALEVRRAALAAWAAGVADVRVHATTQRRPLDLFEEERLHLASLPAETYEIARFGQHRVRKDCHVHVLGNHYSVPYRLVGQEVLVRLTETRVTAFAGQEVVADHARAVGAGQDVTDRAHYPEYKREATQEVHARRVLQVREAGPHAATLVGRLREGRQVRSDELLALVALLERFGGVAFERACERALYFDAVEGAARLERILERGLEREPLPAPAPTPAAAEGFGRPLEEYGALLEQVA